MTIPVQPSERRLCSYVLITPARNEEKYIESAIQAVISQSHRPVRWVIVSDNSIDRTDDIVRSYLPDHPWIQLVRNDGHRLRNFASKAGSVNRGYREVRQLEFDVIGNLDADITFESGYFEFLMNRFAEDPELGVAGTAFIDDSMKYNYEFVGLEHVAGLCQLFRRACFEEIGGYCYIPGGGVDLVAVTTARMKGWKTRTFPEISCRHHRKMGTSLSGPVRLRYRFGREDYYLGSHPMWQMLRCLRHIGDRPFLVAALSLFAGYAVSWVRRYPRPVSDDFVRFRRREQMRRLGRIVCNAVTPNFLKNRPSGISYSQEPGR